MAAQSSPSKVFSVEFFPPKTVKGEEKLRRTLEELAPLRPAYGSVTFGAGGSTQQGTLETVLELQRRGFDAAPHLSCIGASRETIRQLLTTYQHHGVRRIVALRGDLPSGTGLGGAGEFRHANELVRFIREETGDHFTIEVAAYPEMHPQAPSFQQDVDNFKRKVDSGADGAITQYFYNPEAYFHFVQWCEKIGITIPIVPGIMPITNYTQLARFSDACGAEIPRWIRKRLMDFGDDRAAIHAFGLEVVTRLCRELLDNGAPGLHFYTMNQADAVKALWHNLGLTP